MTSSWYHFFAKVNDKSSRFEWIDRPNWSDEQWMRLRRGEQPASGTLALRWVGTSTPPDFFRVWFCCEAVSTRALDQLGKAGVTGLSFLPFGVSVEGKWEDYSVLATTQEVKSVCFETEVATWGSSKELGGPRVEGLDEVMSDIFVLPIRAQLQDFVVSEHFLKICRASRLSNWGSSPLSQLTVTLTDPERVACED